VGLDGGEAAVQLRSVCVDLESAFQFLAFAPQTLQLDALAFELPLQLLVALVEVGEPVASCIYFLDFYRRSRHIVIGFPFPLLENARRKRS
jgi:hypothetical protein